MIFQAAELGDTGRQVVLWVAMALALWQLLMFAASTFVQGENLAMIIWASSLWLPTEVQDLATDQLCLAITWQGNNNGNPSSFSCDLVFGCTAHTHHLLASVLKVYTKS